MFKNGPFGKSKDGSKTIVGRIVDVEGKETGEYHNSNTNKLSTSTSSFQKSTTSSSTTFSSSVSRIFGASPYKKTSTTRTPGRKLLKRLICTPGKARSFPDSSVSEIDDFGTYIPNNNSNTTGLTVSRSNSSEETNSIQASNFGGMPSSPPRLARKLLQEDDTNSNRVLRTSPMMKSPTKAQNYQMSNSINSINSSKRVDDALLAASNRSGFNEDMIFMTNSTSSDDLDHRNESESNPMSRMQSSSSSPYSSPQQYERHSPPSRVDRNAMKSPGIGIATPVIALGSGLPFPHSLCSIHNSPIDEMNATTPNPKNLSTQFQELEDDDAFLPDDFTHPTNKQDEVTFTLEDVEQKIREAKREERLTLREQHERDIEECIKEFERVMINSGKQWKKESDEQEVMYQKLLKEERHKTSLKHHELINKAQSLQDVKDAMEEIQAERELLNLRVKDLETREEKMSAAGSQTPEVESLRKDKRNAENRISELESELHRVVDPLKREKEIADQKAAALSEQLRVLIESSDQSQNQLQETLQEIALLKGQLAELPSVDPEEIRTSKLEAENLRNLRAEDEKEIHALQSQLSQIIDEHRDLITPQKKPINSGDSESPCVGGIDNILRVEYDKAQDQLKAMGKVLKRYKSERDDLKAKIQELEQLHVQAIKIAVNQATQDQKEKVQLLMEEIQLLTEENEVLQQQPKEDIGEQMINEMKTHIDDLKKSHEDEIVQLRETLDNRTKNAEELWTTLKAQFAMKGKELQKKIDSMLQEIEQLQTNKNDELSLVKSSSKEEVDSLKVELRESENEKNEIIKNTSKECEALQDQIKTMNEMHSEELELVVAENREEVDSLKKKVHELDLEAKSSGALSEDVVNKLKSNYEDALKEATVVANVDIDALSTKLQLLKEEKDAETEKASKIKAQIGEIQVENAARIEKVRGDYDRQIREVKSRHASESDELLAQLDLIEAEAAQRFKNAEAAVTEKDAVIMALGAQVAESESRVAVTSKEDEVLREEIESLRSDLEVITASNEVKQKEITTLIERHDKEIEDQIPLRERACNEAREEMIALAEGQLAERQEYYQALKRELDNAQSRISVLERDLRFATKELEEMGRRHEASEADLRDELAQSKAAIAAKDANLIRAKKVHQAEVDLAREAEKAMKSKFEESQATSHSVQKTLATLVTEKQRLEQECADITAISEELATLCEKNKLM